MKKLILLLIAITSYSNIQSQDWELLNENEEFTVYIRAHSDNSAWFKFEYKKEIEKTILISKYRIKKILTLIKFDCSKKMMGTLAEHCYDKDDKQTYSSDSGDYASMENIIPDTTGEFLLNSFCNTKK